MFGLDDPATNKAALAVPLKTLAGMRTVNGGLRLIRRGGSRQAAARMAPRARGMVLVS